MHKAELRKQRVMEGQWFFFIMMDKILDKRVSHGKEVKGGR
jgi:hypothetical protein